MRQPSTSFFVGLGGVAYGLHWLVTTWTWHLPIAFGIYPPIFTLQEYLAHRFLLHRDEGTIASAHAKHHRYATDLRRVFVPIPVTLLLAFGNVLGVWMLWPAATPSVAMSMILCYLLFEFAHLASHTAQAPGLLDGVRRHHLLHHTRSDTNYGFVCASWDLWCRTHRTTVRPSLWLHLPYPILPFVAAQASWNEWIVLAVTALPLMVSSDEAVYRSFHTHPVNVAIHVATVPCLVWSVLAAFARVRLANGLTMAHVAAVVHTIPHLSTVAGWVTLVWMSALAVYASGREWSNRLVVAVHVSSWGAQVLIGHLLFEGNRPAVLESLVPTLLVAPVTITRDGIVDSMS